MSTIVKLLPRTPNKISELTYIRIHLCDFIKSTVKYHTIGDYVYNTNKPKLNIKTFDSHKELEDYLQQEWIVQ